MRITWDTKTAGVFLLVLALVSAVEFVANMFGPKTMLVTSIAVAMATFCVGFFQSAYSRFFADMWTDERRETNRQQNRCEEIEPVLRDADSVLDKLRLAVAEAPDTNIRKFLCCDMSDAGKETTIYPSGKPAVTKTEPPYITARRQRLNEHVKTHLPIQTDCFVEHKLMFYRLQEVGLVNVNEESSGELEGTLSAELYDILTS